MAAIYSNGGNRWNILGFGFTKRDELSSVYKISIYMMARNNFRWVKNGRWPVYIHACINTLSLNGPFPL